MELEPPPNKVPEFEYRWRNWLNNVYEKLRGPVWKKVTFYLRDAATGANAPTLSAFGPSSVGIEYEFNRNDIAYGTLQMPTDLKPGSTAYMSVHWTQDASSSGIVEWVLTYSFAEEGDVFSTPTSLTVTDTASATAWVHQETMSTTGVTIPVGAGIFIGNVARGNTSDTYADLGQGNVWAMAVDIHYQSDRLGTVNKDADYYRRGN